MSDHRTCATRFFQLLSERRFSEAEREFKQLRNMMRKNDWSKGYAYALNGMLLAKKSSDGNLFLSNVNSKDKNDLNEHHQEFSRLAKDGLNADYDRGFFTAWTEYLLFLLK